MEVVNIDGAEKIMKETAEDTLVRWKSWSGGKWIRIYDATVDKIIRNRREIDRKSRNIKEGKKEALWEYQKAKERVKERVNLLVEGQEESEVEMIRENRRRVWALIQKISGKEKMEKEIKLCKNRVKLNRKKEKSRL